MILISFSSPSNIFVVLYFQFQIQSTLTGVAQAVVDKVVRIHHDTYMTKASKGDLLTGGKRDDITLLIRNFNYPMPRSLTSGGPHVRFDPVPTITNYPRADPESDAGKLFCHELLLRDCAKQTSNFSSCNFLYFFPPHKH